MKTFKEFVELQESVKLIQTINDQKKSAKIYKDSNNNEFVVKFFVNDKYVGNDSDYFTSDKEDAIGTATNIIKKL